MPCWNKPAELNRRVTDIEVLQEVYGALETAELEDGLANVVTRTLLLTEADYGAIYLLDRSTQEPVLFLAALPEGRASKNSVKIQSQSKARAFCHTW